MKTPPSPQTAPSATTRERFSLTGFSRRLARPSVGRTVSSLNASLRSLDDLWDFTLVDRLHSPLSRRHY